MTGIIKIAMLGIVFALVSSCARPPHQVDQQYVDLTAVKIACAFCASEHGGRFPRDWAEVMSYSNQTTRHMYGTNAVQDSIFSSPSRWPAYTYIGGLSTNEPIYTVVAYEIPKESAKGAYVLFVCGLQQVTMETFTKVVFRGPNQASQTTPLCSESER